MEGKLHHWAGVEHAGEFYRPNDEIFSPSTQKLHTLPIPDN
jgi:hypothetical protein